MDFPNKKYNIIYADPPWKYRDKRQNPNSDRPARYGGISYDVMDTNDIANLPVNEIAEDNCMLFMWVTFPNLQIGLDVIKAWGFDYRTLGFSWIKLNKKNEKQLVMIISKMWNKFGKNVSIGSSI